MLSGCAVSYIDGDGSRHVIGLVNVEIESADGNETYVGDIVTLRGAGLVVHAEPDATDPSLSIVNATLGYAGQTTALLRNCDVASSAADCADGEYSRARETRVAGLYTDWKLRNGGLGYFGLIKATLPPTDAKAPLGGIATELETVGITFGQDQAASDISIGYRHSALAAIGPNSFVRGNPVGLRHEDPTMTAMNDSERSD